MKTIFNTTIFTVLLCCIFIKANAQVEISGQVKDNSTKEALIFSTISVYNLSDSLITGGVTDDNGFFSIPLHGGSYNLVSSYVGFQPDTLNINVQGENEFLGTIKLDPDKSELKEVEIKASTSKFTIDKDVQLVTTKMRAGSANTSDLLERMKGIAYDRYNNSIKVDGDDNIILLVNGLEKNQEYIKSLSPDKLKEVEIVRNPSGRYALDGYSAIVNVILKDDYEGTEVYVENMAMFDTDTKEAKPLPINNFSLSYNYTYNKLNIYAKVDNDYSSVKVLGESIQESNNGYVIENTPLGGKPNLGTNNLNNNYTIGADYYINPKQTISYESNIGAFPSSRQITNHSYDVAHYKDGIVTDNYKSEMVNNSSTKDLSNSLFYIYKIDYKTQINADFTHLKYTDEYSNSISQSNGFERYETGINKKDYTKFYLELNHNISENSSIMAGYGNTWRQLDNNFTVKTTPLSVNDFISDTSNFSLTETRHKLYAYYSLKMSDVIRFKIGAATEYSHPKAGELDKTYVIYQPHLDFDIAAHESVHIKLKYRAYSKYPTIKESTPFIHMIDPYTMEKGNPLLEPELTHRVSTKFRIMNGLLTLEPYYEYSNNKINRTIISLNENVLEYSYDNVGKYISQGIKGDITIPLFKQSLIIQSSFDFFKSSITYNGKNNNIKDWVMNTQMLYISKKYATVAGLNYQKGIKKLINAQGYDYYNTDYWMLFVQQPLLKNKMTIMLGYILPIDLGVIYEQGSYVDMDIFKATTTYDISMLKNMLMLRLTYRFSNGKRTRSIDKDIEMEIEKTSKGLF
ncbi:MAG: TonB-dependent receptor [Candidatus Scalindua sp.]|nr:TonB-dependent receptor [Candidatus Scalindua sp.]